MVGEHRRGERIRRGGSPGRVLFALGLLAAFVLAALSAGGSYLFCVPMQRAMSACCHATSSEAELSGKQAPDAQPAVRAPCCEGRAIGELPSSTAQAEGLDVPSAPVSLLPPAPPSPAPLVRVSTRSEPRGALLGRPVLHDRSRAGPPRASELCVALCVLRC